MTVSVVSSNGQLLSSLPSGWRGVATSLLRPSTRQRDDLTGNESPIIVGRGACRIPAISAHRTVSECSLHTDGGIKRVLLHHYQPRYPDSTSVFTHIDVGPVIPETNTRKIVYQRYIPRHQSRFRRFLRGGASDFDTVTDEQEVTSDLCALPHSRPSRKSCLRPGEQVNELLVTHGGSVGAPNQHYWHYGLRVSDEPDPEGFRVEEADHTVFSRRFKVDLSQESPAMKHSWYDSERHDELQGEVTGVRSALTTWAKGLGRSMSTGHLRPASGFKKLRDESS